jgi:dTDP-4-amino-4,6-dideoxygalactose transaminase
MVKQFEAALKTYIGSQNVMAVSNGTSALQAALRALDLGPGDEVITTPFTFGATWNAILSTGATLVYVDISSEDFNIQIDQMAEAITSRTRVLLPVHLYGSPLDLQSLQTTTQRKEIRVVEDCAQAIGATSRELHVGTLDIGTFSFYATKNITTGEGGAVTSQDDEHSRRVRLLRNQGFESPYNYEVLGENHRMTDIAAAIGLGELASYEKRLSQRARNADC